MKQTHEVILPLAVDDVWRLLDDPETLAAAMPGATLDEVNGDVMSGRVQVRLGPMNLTYAGTATITERSDENRELRMTAAGSEQRGAGTANADVVISVVSDGDCSRMIVETDLALTGRPAQLGAGMVHSVAGKLFQQFADRLGEMTESDDAGGRDPMAVKSDAIDMTVPALIIVGSAIGMVGILIYLVRRLRATC